MHPDLESLRRRNRDRAAEDAERGPAERDQKATPILDALRYHHANAVWPGCIPAHKKGSGAPRSALEQLGAAVYENDLTMLHGVDNRHQSWQVQETAQELFAEAVGADKTMFSTNGSTASVHTAMAAVVDPGEKLLIARNGHKSQATGLILTGVLPVWLEPEYDDELQLAHGVSAETLRRALANNPDARAAMITTPTVYGVSTDIEALVELCHERDLPLLTDDAWGLAYPFCSKLPGSAIESGADLTIGSAHKTIGALGQTSVFSMQGDRIDPSRLSLALEIFESTSASSILLASIDAARHEMVHSGESLLNRALELAARLRREVDALPGLALMQPEDVLHSPGADAFNPLHVSFDVLGLGLTGYAAGDWLRDQAQVDAELTDHRRVMLLVSIGDDDRSIDQLSAAVSALVEVHRGGDGSDYVPDMPKTTELRTEQVLRPRDAFFAEAKAVPVELAEGEISAEFVTPYPPGVPLIAPGERVTEPLVEYLEKGAAAGIFVEGAADPSLETVRVVSKAGISGPRTGSRQGGF